MAELSQVAGTERFRLPLGNRFLVSVHLASVSNGADDYVTGATLGLSFVDKIVGAVDSDGANAVRAVRNSEDFGSTTTNGSVSLTISGIATHDVYLTVIGIPG